MPLLPAPKQTPPAPGIQDPLTSLVSGTPVAKKQAAAKKKAEAPRAPFLPGKAPGQSDMSPSPIPTEPLPTTGPPVPSLQRYGVNMSMSQVNKQVEDLTAAHLKAFGYSPSPGMIFDVLKAQGVTGPINAEDLFGIPHSATEAKAMIVARQGSGDTIATLPVIQPKTGDILRAMLSARKADEKAGLLNAYTNNQSSFSQMAGSYVKQALADPSQADILVKGLMKAGVTNPVPYLLGVANYDWKGMNTSIVNKTADQIMTSLTNMPYGFYKLIRGAGLDAFDLSSVPLHDLAQSTGMHFLDVKPRADKAYHLAHIAQAMKDSMIQDVTHPTDRPGFLLMDIWGAATVGAGAVGRAGLAGEAARAGSVGGVVKALVFKSPPAFTEMGIPGYTATLPLSDTWIVRMAQEHTPIFGRSSRQARLVADQTDGLESGSMREHVNEILGTEKSLRRARERDVQIHYALALTPTIEMTRLARWDHVARSVMSDVISSRSFKGWKDLAVEQKVGVQKALQILFTDDPDPVGVWRSFHSNELAGLREQRANLTETAAGSGLDPIELARAHREIDYSMAAHRAQLEAVDLAQSIILDPPKRFIPLLKRAYEVAHDQQQLKQIDLGLDPEIADQEVARIGAWARGENVISLGKNEKGLPVQGIAPPGLTTEGVQDLIERVAKKQKTWEGAKSRLSRAQATNRLHPGKNAQELGQAQKTFDMHDRALGNLQRNLEQVRANATPLERKVTAENAGLVGPEEIRKLREGGPGSTYFPIFPEKYRGGKVKNSYGTQTTFGLKPNQFLFKANTGDALQLGDFRWDMTNLLGEQFKIAYQAATRRTQWHDLWNASVKDRISEHHRPIRNIQDVPDALREVVQALERQKMDKKFSQIVDESKMQALQDFLYPTDEMMRTLDPKQVKWVDERMIMNRVGGRDTQFWATADQMMNKVMAPINEPMRTLLIFATPAYALNALGSAALLLTHSGFLAPLDLGRAMNASRTYGPEVTRILDRLAGQTHASSLVTETRLINRASQGLANVWQQLTDLHFRRAAVIHELRRNGLLREHLSNEELKATLLDSENFQKVSQSAQTARKAMLDFNSISWPEKAVLRHLFFVYSFVRSSAIWSMRFLRDHGVQSDVLAHAGESRQQNIDEMIGHMPDWFMKQGYFAVHPGVVYNPIQWSMPAMLEQTATPLTALFGHTPYSTPAELLGPAAQFGYEALTGNDLTGKALPKPGGWEGHIPGSHGTVGKSIMSLWNETSWGGLTTKAKKAAKEAANPIPPPPVRSGKLDVISAARAQERAGLNESVLSVDGWWNTTGAAIFRSGVPRDVNKIAGEARYWRDLRASNPAAYHKHEMDLVHAMVTRQEKVLGEPASPDVVQAVDTMSHVSQAIEDYKAKHVGEPAPNKKQTNMITLDALVAEGRIKDRAHWAKEIDNAQDRDQKGVQTLMLLQAGGKAWFDWVQRVNAVDNYAQPKYAEGVDVVKQLGLGDYSQSTTQPREARWAYGRKVEGILQKSKELKAAVGASTGYQAQIAKQEWTQYVNENDKPITVRGVTYPSPFAYQLASETEGARARAIASIVKKNPKDFTAMQEQLITGKRTDPIVSRAWTTYYEILKEAKAKLPFGQNLPAGEKAYYLNAIAAQVPAFKKALDFSREPLAQRMQGYKPIQTSRYADDWNWVLRQATNFHTAAAKTYVDSNGKPISSLITKGWATNVPVITEAIKKNFSKGFLSELAAYTGAQDAQHADEYLDKFLVRLVKP